MISRLRQRMGREEGFTLVELLVVMLILGILAAIAIPSFFNQRDKARDAEAKAGARTAQTAMETYATDNGGSYLNATAASLRNIEPTLNEVTLAEPSNLLANTYTVTVTSDAGQVFTITRNANGTTDLECTVASTDGCPASTDADAPGEWD